MNKIDMEELKKILYVDEDLYNQYGKRNEDGLWIFFDEYADQKIEKNYVKEWQT